MATDVDDGNEVSIAEGPREDGLSDQLMEQRETGIATVLSTRLTQLDAYLERISQRLDQLVEARDVAKPSLEDGLARLVDEFAGRQESLSERFSALEGRLAAFLESRQESELVSPPLGTSSNKVQPLAGHSADSYFASEPVMRAAGPLPTSSPAVSGNDSEVRWERRLLGPELCDRGSLVEHRRELMASLWADDAAAVGLAGRLMLIQSASADEVPTLLREIGEAYYRWRPKNKDVADPFEEALVEAVDKRIGEVGLRNSVELVRPGDRYDATRHVTPDRGIEVTVVRGWVVLRDNGKPLTKASVSLR